MGCDGIMVVDDTKLTEPAKHQWRRVISGRDHWVAGKVWVLVPN